MLGYEFQKPSGSINMNTEVIFVGCSSTNALYKAHVHIRSTHRVIHPILAELSMRVKKERRRERERREDNLYAFDSAGRNMDERNKKGARQNKKQHRNDCEGNKSYNHNS